MLMAETVTYGDFKKALDAARRTAPNGAEYWLGRDLQEILKYVRWENFEELIEKARLACDRGGGDTGHQLRPTAKMVVIGSGTERKVQDWFLSRYACYLIAMNGDPRLPRVAY